MPPTQERRIGLPSRSEAMEPQTSADPRDSITWSVTSPNSVTQAWVADDVASHDHQQTPLPPRPQRRAMPSGSSRAILG